MFALEKRFSNRLLSVNSRNSLCKDDNAQFTTVSTLDQSYRQVQSCRPQTKHFSTDILYRMAKQFFKKSVLGINCIKF